MYYAPGRSSTTYLQVLDKMPAKCKKDLGHEKIRCLGREVWVLEKGLGTGCPLLWPMDEDAKQSAPLPRAD